MSALTEARNWITLIFLDHSRPFVSAYVCFLKG